MRIVGFLNRGHSFPSPLVTVGREGDLFVAVFPSGDKYVLSDVATEDQLHRRPTFVAADPPREVAGAPVSYGISPDKISFGSPQEVGGKLRAILRDTFPPLDDLSRALIQEFLASAPDWVAQLTVERFGELAERDSALSISYNRRQTRRGAATTFIVQQHRPGRTRTLYRKGIPVNMGPHQVRVSSNVREMLTAWT